MPSGGSTRIYMSFIINVHATLSFLSPARSIKLARYWLARWFDPKTRSRMSFSLSVLRPRALLLRSFCNAHSSPRVIDLKTAMKIYLYQPYLAHAAKRARNSRRLCTATHKSRCIRYRTGTRASSLLTSIFKFLATRSKVALLIRRQHSFVPNNLSFLRTRSRGNSLAYVTFIFLRQLKMRDVKRVIGFVT